jgi:beta-N-acetylhexosaminidase
VAVLTERTAGQLLLAGFEGKEPSAEVRELITDRSLAGVILFARNCGDPYQVLELTNSLQEIARRAGHSQPLLVAIDQEQGRVARLREGVTLFPAMGEIAALDDPSLTARVAAAVSRELLALGVNWNLAPVADVLSTASCPVGDRSFGDDPERVGQMTAAFVRGAEGAGMISCLKHFPGHGGTDADSHFTVPRIEKSRRELEAVDFPPFRKGIDAGAAAVMTTHITFPAVDPSLPATFSPRVIGGLLRRDLGFPGVIVSDDLEMAGSAEKFSLNQGGILALRAGVDLLLVSGMLLPQRDVPGLLDAVVSAVASRAVDPQQVELSLARLAGLKERYLADEWRRDPEEARKVLRCPEHIRLLDEVRARILREAGDAVS